MPACQLSLHQHVHAIQAKKLGVVCAPACVSACTRRTVRLYVCLGHDSQALEHEYFSNSPAATAPALLPKVFSQLGQDRPATDQQLRQPDFGGAESMVLGGKVK